MQWVDFLWRTVQSIQLIGSGGGLGIFLLFAWVGYGFFAYFVRPIVVRFRQRFGLLLSATGCGVIVAMLTFIPYVGYGPMLIGAAALWLWRFFLFDVIPMQYESLRRLDVYGSPGVGVFATALVMTAIVALVGASRRSVQFVGYAIFVVFVTAGTLYAVIAYAIGT